MAYPQFERLQKFDKPKDYTPVNPAQTSDTKTQNIQTPHGQKAKDPFMAFYIGFAILAIGIYNARV